MKITDKVSPFSCRCKLNNLVPYLKQAHGLVTVPAPRGSARINVRAAEAVFVQYI